MAKVAKVIVYIVGGIIMIVALIIAVIVVGYVISESNARSEKREITKNAVLYISDKYGVEESKINLSHTNLYGEHEKCMFSCWENTTNVQFDDKECLMTYSIEKDYYTDDCQGEEIKTAFENHIKKKYSFITEVNAYEDEDGTPIKYDNDIDDYFKKVNEFNAKKNGLYNYGISAKIWIKADNNNQAKDIYTKKVKNLVVYLEELGLDYSINISSTNTDYEYYAFYFINSYDEYFRVVDNVDKNNIKGDRSNYKDGSFIK